MPQLHFAKRWFFATGPAMQLVKGEAGPELPMIVTKFHNMLAEDLYEYQWAKIADGSALDGWFQPKSVHADEIISKIPGVTLLPALHDPTPAGNDLAQLLKHAGITPADVGYTVIKKLCDYHHGPGGYPHVGLRPELY